MRYRRFLAPLLCCLSIFPHNLFAQEEGIHHPPHETTKSLSHKKILAQALDVPESYSTLMDRVFNRRILALSPSFSDSLFKKISLSDEPPTIHERYFILRFIPPEQWPENFIGLLEEDQYTALEHKFIWATANDLGLGIPVNSHCAITLYQECAQAGLAQAYHCLASCFERGEHNQPVDFKKALDYYAKAVDLNFAPSQFNLYVIHKEGVLTGKPNPILALSYLEQAANQELANAQMALGLHYYKGFPEGGITPDLAKAIHFLKGVARQTPPNSPLCINSTSLVSDLFFIHGNHEKSFKWTHKSAAQGNRVTQKRLEHMYIAGIGCPVDAQESFKWSLNLAIQGDVESQFSCGFKYLGRIGVPRNLKEAHKWFTQAHQNNHPQALSFINIITLFFERIQSTSLLNEACEKFQFDRTAQRKPDHNDPNHADEELTIQEGPYSIIGDYITALNRHLKGLIIQDAAPEVSNFSPLYEKFSLCSMEFLDPNDKSQIETLFAFFVKEKMITEKEAPLYQQEFFGED